MLESFLRYLRFLSKSTNQHGVHSPFVYSYLTEGIYNTKRSYKGYQKKRRLLQATIDYFQVKNILGTPEFQIDPNKEKANQFGKEAYIKLHYIKAIETFTKEELRELIKSIDENTRSEEHTSELQSRGHLVCRLLLEKKKGQRHQEQ